MLILEALLADGETCRADEVHLVLTARPGSFALLMGPLAGSEAQRLLLHAALPLVGPVVERLAAAAMTVDDGSHLLVVIDAAVAVAASQIACRSAASTSRSARAPRPWPVSGS